MASTVRFLRKSLSLRSSKREKNSLAAQLEEERRRYEREQEEEAQMRRERRRSRRSRRAPREEEVPVDRRRSMRDAFDGADMSLQDKLRARARTSLRRSAAYGAADLCREPVGW